VLRLLSDKLDAVAGRLPGRGPGGFAEKGRRGSEPAAADAADPATVCPTIRPISTASAVAADATGGQSGADASAGGAKPAACRPDAESAAASGATGECRRLLDRPIWRCNRSDTRSIVAGSPAVAGEIPDSANDGAFAL
jgi:hypothetical protein